MRPEDGAAGFYENLVPINQASQLHNLVPINKASQLHSSENVAMFNILHHIPALHDFRCKINSL